VESGKMHAGGGEPPPPSGTALPVPTTMAPAIATRGKGPA